MRPPRLAHAGSGSVVSVVVALVAVASLSGPGDAQEADRAEASDTEARVVGIVREEGSREPLRAVRVRLSGGPAADRTEREATTDGRGVFRFDGLSPGTYRVRTRHLGYRTAEAELTLAAGEERPVTVLMTPRPVELPGVEAEVPAETWLPGFRWRREHLDGHFLTRKDIVEEDPVRVTDLVRSLPEVRVRYRPDEGWYTTMFSRGSGWAEDARCKPHIVLNGQWVPRDLLEMSLNEIEPEDVLAMEVYWKPVELPDDLDPPPSVLGEGAAGPGSGIEAGEGGPVGDRGPTSMGGLEQLPFSDMRTSSCGTVVVWTELEAGRLEP